MRHAIDFPTSLRRRTPKIALALLSVILALAAGEGLLRWALFHTDLDLAAKDPTYYARDADEVWIYRHLFTKRVRSGDVPDQPIAEGSTRIAFYRRWATSLQPDAELGYVRRPNVKTPCHETTSLATRGLRDDDGEGRRIAFFGDSFVESAACSNDTLTTKIERQTGIETLNYGVGGYGLDQMLLSFERVRAPLDRAGNLVLIGLIQDDLERVLLKVRTSAKPYFTIDGDGLALHTDHIHPASLEDAFERPPMRSYLFDFLRGRFGDSAYATAQRTTRDARKARVRALSQRIFERFAAHQRAGRFELAIVILPTPGAPFDPDAMASIRALGIPLVDLQGCLRASGLPDTDLYAELHPTSVGNTLLATCLVGDLQGRGLLR